MVYVVGKGKMTCPDGTKVAAGSKCPHEMKTCPDGKKVRPGHLCPSPPNIQKSKPVVLASIILGAFLLLFLLVATMASYRAPSSMEQKWAYWSTLLSLLTAAAVVGCVSTTWNQQYTGVQY